MEYTGEWDSDMYEGQGKLINYGDTLEGFFFFFFFLFLKLLTKTIPIIIINNNNE